MSDSGQTLFFDDESDENPQYLPVYHHVFSSLKGYKTIYKSHGLSEGLVKILEEFAVRAYSAPGEKDFFLCIKDSGDNWVLSKLFDAGSDHVGRQRYCVHSIYIFQEDIKEWPGFHPFLLQHELFLNESARMENLPPLIENYKLADSELGAVEFDRDKWRPIIKDSPSALVKSLFSDDAFILSGDQLLEKIKKFSKLLPHWQKFDLTLIQGSHQFPFPDQLESPRLRIIEPRQSSLFGEEVIDINQQIQLNESSSIKNFIGYCLKKKTFNALQKVYNFIGLYAEPHLPLQHQNYFLDGLIPLLSILESSGMIKTKNLELVHLQSVLPFFKSTAFSIGFQILEFFARNSPSLPVEDTKLLKKALNKITQLKKALEEYDIQEINKGIEADLNAIIQNLMESFDIY